MWRNVSHSYTHCLLSASVFISAIQLILIINAFKRCAEFVVDNLLSLRVSLFFETPQFLKFSQTKQNPNIPKQSHHMSENNSCWEFLRCELNLDLNKRIILSITPSKLINSAKFFPDEFILVILKLVNGKNFYTRIRHHTQIMFYLYYNIKDI